MKKRIDEEALINELKGQSAFFRRPSPPVESNLPPSEAVQTSEPPVNEAISAPVTSPKRHEEVSPTKPTSSVPLPAPQPSAHAPFDENKTTTPIGDASTLASNQASLLASYHASIIDAIRKTVKSVGKEVSFVRLTPEEKNQLSEIAYTYKRQGIKTSENEISRIAINFLLEDFKTNGEASILAKVLASLLA